MCRLKSQICPPPSDDSGDDEGKKKCRWCRFNHINYWLGSITDHRNELKYWRCAELVVRVTDWMTAEPFCTSSSSSFFLYQFLLVLPSLPPIPVSPFVILLLGAGDSPRWRITAQLDRAAEPRDLSRLISVSFPSSSSWAELNYSCLIFNLLPF